MVTKWIGASIQYRTATTGKMFRHPPAASPRGRLRGFCWVEAAQEPALAVSIRARLRETRSALAHPDHFAGAPRASPVASAAAGEAVVTASEFCAAGSRFVGSREPDAGGRTIGAVDAPGGGPAAPPYQPAEDTARTPKSPFGAPGRTVRRVPKSAA